GTLPDCATSRPVRQVYSAVGRAEEGEDLSGLRQRSLYPRTEPLYPLVAPGVKLTAQLERHLERGGLGLGLRLGEGGRRGRRCGAARGPRGLGLGGARGGGLGLVVGAEEG